MFVNMTVTDGSGDAIVIETEGRLVKMDVSDLDDGSEYYLFDLQSAEFLCKALRIAIEAAQAKEAKGEDDE